MANRSEKFYTNPLLLVVIAALVVAAALIVASQWSARHRQPVVSGPEPTEPGPSQGTQPTEEPARPEQPQEVPVIMTATTAQPTKGDPDAPVTIIEFAEFYCPFCARYLWETYPEIESEYIRKGLVNYEFRNLVVHGKAALLAAVAGECAHEQGRFWELHDRLFEAVFPGRNVSQLKQLGLDDLKEIAVAVGLDTGSFNRCIEGYNEDYNSCLADYTQCMEEGGEQERCAEEFGEEANKCLSSNRVVAKILDDQEELRRLIDRLPSDERPRGIGTPTFFINGHILVGAQPYENFKRIIDRELEKAQDKQ